MSFTKHIETAIILDTNPGFRTDVSAMLKKAGVEVLRPTQNGKMGYQEIAKSRVKCDLVIANIELEDINAIQFMSALRKNNRFKTTHVVIGLTGDLLANIEDALTFGLSGFFEKPIGLPELAQYLDQLFSMYDVYDGNDLALYNLAAARFYISQKQYKNALAHLEENLKLGDAAEVFFNLGKCQAMLTNKAEAKQAFQRAIGLDESYKNLVKEFSTQHPFDDDVTDKSDISEDALELFGVPTEQLSGGFYDQHRLRQAIVCSSSFDDNATLRNMLVDMGIDEVTSYSRGQDALQDVKSKGVDLVIAAIQVEDMNGLQLIDVIRRDPECGQRTKILLWLEEEMADNLPKAYQVGLDGYLLKPYSANSLRDALHKLMIDDAVTAATEPLARRLTKAALGFFRLNNFEQGTALAHAAVERDPEAGMPMLALAMNVQSGGDLAGAAEHYRKAEQLNERLGPLAKRMYRWIADMVDPERDESANSGESTDNGSNVVGPAAELNATDSETAVPSDASPQVSFALSTFEDEDPDLGLEAIGSDEVESEPGDNYVSDHAAASQIPGYAGTDSHGRLHDEADEGDATGANYRKKSKPGAPVFEREEDLPEPDFDLGDAVKLKQREAIEVRDDLSLSAPAAMDTHSRRKKEISPAKNEGFAAINPRAAANGPTYEVDLPAVDDDLFALDAKQLKRNQRGGAIELNSDLALTNPDVAKGSGLKNALNKKKQQLSGIQDSVQYHEQVFTASAKRNLETHAIHVDIGAPVITSWMPPERLQKLPIPADGLVKQPEKLGQLETFGKSFKGLIEQAQLFNGRIVCRDDEDQPEALTSYLAKIGSSMRTQQAQGRIAIDDKKLASKIDKLSKKVEKQPQNHKLVAQLGRLYMESGVVDNVFEKVHAHWSMNDHLKAGRMGDAVNSAVKSGLGDTLLDATLKTGNGIKLLEALVKNGGGVRIIEEALKTGGGVHFLERFSESEGGIKVVEKEVRSGGGVRFLERIIEEGKGLRFLGELVKEGGGAGILEMALQSSASLKILSDTLHQGGGVSWISDEVQPFTATLMELRQPIVKLHEHFWQGKEQSELLLKQALTNLNRKDVQVEREDFDEVLAADNYSLETFKKIYHGLKQNGFEELGENFYKLNAPRYYDSPDVVAALGNNMLQLGEVQKATDAFEKALKEDKGNYSYLKNMAITALQNKKHREVERWCNRMIRLQPRNSEAYNLLGINCKKQRKFKKSIGYYLQGIKVDPESVKLYHNLSIAYAQIGQDERSRKMFRKAKLIQKAQTDLNAYYDDLQEAG